MLYKPKTVNKITLSCTILYNKKPKKKKKKKVKYFEYAMLAFFVPHFEKEIKKKGGGEHICINLQAEKSFLFKFLI